MKHLKIGRSDWQRKSLEMRRSIWWPNRLEIGQKISFQNETYKVVAQHLHPMDSYHFDARYYTTVKRVS